MIQQSTLESRSTDAPLDLEAWPGVVIELKSAPDPSAVFLRLCHLPHCVFFDSARSDTKLGRYSFIAADPFEVVTASADDGSAWNAIEHWMHRLSAPTIPGLPPFQGGLAGLFSYDFSRTLERLPHPRFNEFQLPGVLLGLYDVAVAFDHQSEQAWIISQGFPEKEPALRQRRAKSRATDLLWHLQAAEPTRPAAVSSPISIAQFSPQHPVGNLANLTSNFSHDDYLEMIQRGIEYIFAGDVFQVNLAQRLLYPACDDSVSLYLRLRQCNPAPFAAYFDLGDFQVVSASPERFLQLRDRAVETRPIKGTRPHTNQRDVDRSTGLELLASEKDRAENVMIVDLLRNDLSQVCRPDSVIVSKLCGLERYEFVQHLVSVVQGALRDDRDPVDLLRAVFPGGSVTGAQKSGLWKSLQSWNQQLAERIAGRLGILASMAQWIPAF